MAKAKQVAAPAPVKATSKATKVVAPVKESAKAPKAKK